MRMDKLTSKFQLALADAHRLIERQPLRSPDTPPLPVVVSDCKANVGMSVGNGRLDPFEEALQVCDNLKRDKVQSIVLDPAPHSNRFGLVKRVADALGGDYVPLNELRATAISAAVRAAQQTPPPD